MPLAPDAASGPVPTNAEALAQSALELDRAGRPAEAIVQYEAAAQAADTSGERSVLAEVLRRLAVVRHHRQESEAAWALCRASYAIATSLGCRQLTAEALNTLAAFSLDHGEHDQARQHFYAALCSVGDDAALRGRIEQNLGILSTIQGDSARALDHYRRAIEGFSAAGDDEGLATAYHNLGMVRADERQFAAATEHFAESRALAERLGNRRLRALCDLNQTEVHILQERLADATASINQALQLFDELGDRSGKAAAYRFLGVIHRLSGKLALAQARLEDAIALSRAADTPLDEADASHELALVYRDRGQNREALTLLNAARRLFSRLEARNEVVDVGAKVGELEATYLAVVQEWGQSIESTDTYTFGHSERVATFAVAVAQAFGLDDADQMAVRVGAYLHDVGKVRVPPEILQKAGSLTAEEFDLMKQHPVLGVELLASIAFPWDVVPIIRWHHEKWDGTGYPDGLRGEEIPLPAQIVCIVDVFDALTTTRPYRPALTRRDAIAEIRAHHAWWNPRVLDAFLRSVGSDATGIGARLPGMALATSALIGVDAR